MGAVKERDQKDGKCDIRIFRGHLQAGRCFFLLEMMMNCRKSGVNSKNKRLSRS